MAPPRQAVGISQQGATASPHSSNALAFASNHQVLNIGIVLPIVHGKRMMRSVHPNLDPAMERDQVYPKWALFIVGATLVTLGALAFVNLFVGAAPLVRFTGAMMALGAVAQLLHALLVVGWRGFYAWVLSGALYGVAGLVVIYSPSLASMTSALGVVFALGASAILRLWTGIRLRPQAGWRWLALSGGLTIATSLVVAAGWPVDHAGLFATVLAADLVAQGVSAVASGLSLKADH
jgi:uncharacterized membrane protein HdeD (DUF308 family)